MIEILLNSASESTSPCQSSSVTTITHHTASQSKVSVSIPACSVQHRVPEPIPVLGSQPAGDVSHKPGSRLPLLSARPTVTLATVKRAASNFAAW